MSSKADIGVLGIGVMGRSIALNFADNGGYNVALYNEHYNKVEKLLSSPESEGMSFIPAHDLQSFADSLSSPRRILLMVPAGSPVDDCIAELLPLLSENDIIIDCGNSYFQDTIRREKELAAKGIYFFGVGVSGGEEGARHGPSIMPGGSKKAYHMIEEYLNSIAARYDGEPCCAHIGENGAGHYVKMVHNGIEYADMQLISEAYFVLKNFLRLEYKELAEIFRSWNKRETGSYLVEITADILEQTDPQTGRPMLDIILDRAGQKGTGKWTAQSSLDLGVAAPTIAEAVFARCLSAQRDLRIMAIDRFGRPDSNAIDDNKEEFIESVYQSLLSSKIIAYAQGFDLLQHAAAEYGWELNYSEISSIWRSGCIIRADFLNDIAAAFKQKPDLKNLLFVDKFADIISAGEKQWRETVLKAVASGISLPAFTSALAYFDGMRSDSLWTSMIQAQRDYFGAHTFERVDRPEGEFFHAKWY